MSHLHTMFQRASDSGGSRLAWHGLTPDLLEKARSRVEVVAWLMLATNSLGATLDLLYFRTVLEWWNSTWLLGSAVGVGLAGALVVVARNPRVPHLVVLQLGLLFEVALSMILSFLMPWFLYLEAGTVPLVTWVTPLIILFPLIIPSPPRMTLVAAVTAALTRPAGLFILERLGHIEIEPLQYGLSLVSPAFAVGLAYVGSRIVHGMTVDLAEARRMGSYRLEKKLGQGGMGEVWRAQHELLARPAAVKLIRPEAVSTNPDQQRLMLGRFEREAQTTATLRSPHTIQLYDFGIAHGGAFYYVMELLEGMDLHELVLRFGELSPARAVHLLRQACDSLAEAHEQGLVHRDIKPANLFACRYGRAVDFVKVLDFGLVKVHSEPDSVDGNLTVDGSVGGTPNFIAPEQASSNEVDGRADIYAMGCVAYWMLTNEYVFEGVTPIDTMAMHMRDVPSPPSKRTSQPIPDELERIVLACLEKDPAKRPQDADQLSHLLGDVRVGDEWTDLQAREWWDEHFPKHEREAAAAT